MTRLTDLLDSGFAALVDQFAPVTLGSLVFTGHEVPERISIGGRQALAIHRLPGGARFIDAMGSDDNTLAWRGMFVGPGAGERARVLDLMRSDGVVRMLSFGDYVFNVIVSHVEYSYQDRGAVISYRIRTEIVGEQPDSVAVDPFSAQAIVDDCLTAADLVTSATNIVETYGQKYPGAVSIPQPVIASVYQASTACGSAISSLSSSSNDLSIGDAAGLSQLTQAAAGTQTAIGASAADWLDGGTGGISFASPSELSGVTCQAGALATLVQAGGYVNRARLMRATSSGISTSPIVHS